MRCRWCANDNELEQTAPAIIADGTLNARKTALPELPNGIPPMALWLADCAKFPWDPVSATTELTRIVRMGAAFTLRQL